MASREVQDNPIGSRIRKVYPDIDAHGIRIDEVDDLNYHLGSLRSKKGYCQISGSLMDGSFAGISRKKSFDIDLTWILNENSLQNVHLTSAVGEINYISRAECAGQVGSEIAEFCHDRILSPEKVKTSYSSISTKFRDVFYGDEVTYQWYESLGKICHIDMTPAIACNLETTILNGKLLAEKLHPVVSSHSAIADEIKKADIYLIAKAINKAEELRTWRLSFANAENILFREMKPIQRQAYAILKLVSENIGITDNRPDYVTTYHLKNIMFWSAEEDKWPWNLDIGEAVQHLLRKLHSALKEKKIPLYFLPDVNILPKVDKFDVNSVTDRIELFLAQPKSILQVVPPFPFIEGELHRSFTVQLHIFAAHLTMLVTKIVIHMMMYDLQHERRSDFSEKTTGQLIVLKICQLLDINAITIAEVQARSLLAGIVRYDDPGLDKIKGLLSTTSIGRKIKEMPVLNEHDHQTIYGGESAHLIQFNPAFTLFRKEHLDSIYDCVDFLLKLFEKVKEIPYNR